MDDKYKYARIAYAAYGAAVGGKAWDGPDLKQFDEYSDTIKEGWFAAAAAVGSQYADVGAGGVDTCAAKAA